MIRTRLCLAAATLGVFGVWGAAGQTEGKVKTVPAPASDRTSGVAMYKAYCASCHGLKGRGDGPAATAMKMGMPDLTQLAKKNGGKFPSLKVAGMVMGEGAAVAAHGSADMPVWGPVFRSLEQNASNVKLRVHNLTGYIESLQAK